MFFQRTFDLYFKRGGGGICGGHDYNNKLDYTLDKLEYTLELLLSELQNLIIYVAELSESVLWVGLQKTWERQRT